MEGERFKASNPGSSKPRGYIEDIGIDFLQPQQYYWDAVKNSSRNVANLKASTSGKSTISSSKGGNTLKKDTEKSTDNSIKAPDSNPHVYVKLKLPAIDDCKDHQKGARKAHRESQTKKGLQKTAKVLKDGLEKPSVNLKTADFNDHIEEEPRDDSLIKVSNLELHSKKDFGPSVKRKKRDSSSESVGSDSSSYADTRVTKDATSSPSRKRLSRRRHRVEKQKESNVVTHKFSHANKPKKRKLAVHRRHKADLSDPESKFKKYWICAEAVNDPKLRMFVVVSLVRMSRRFIEAWCRRQKPKPSLSERTDLTKNEIQLLSASDDNSAILEIPPVFSSVIKPKHISNSEGSDNAEKGCEVPGNAIPSACPEQKAIINSVSSSDSENVASTTLVKASHVRSEAKRPRRIRSKERLITVTSSDVLDETIVSVSRLPREKSYPKRESSGSDEDTLFSPKKIKKTRSVSDAVSPDTTASQVPKPPTISLEIPAPTISNSVMLDSDDSVLGVVPTCHATPPACPEHKTTITSVSSSDAQNVAGTTLAKASHVRSEAKRPKRIRSKERLITVTSSDVLDEIIASVSRLPKEKNYPKRMSSGSEGDTLFFPKKIQKTRSVSEAVSPEATASQVTKTPTIGLETPAPTISNSVTRDSDDSVLDDPPTCYATTLNQKSNSQDKMPKTPASRLIDHRTPNFVRLPCSEEDLKRIGIRSRVRVRLERIILPFFGNRLYPNVFCHDVIKCAGSRNSMARANKKLAARRKRATLPPKSSEDSDDHAPLECDNQTNKTVDHARDRSWFLRVKLKPSKRESRYKRHFQAKSKVLITSSSEDSDGKPTSRSAKLTTKSAALDVDHDGSVKTSKKLECKVTDVFDEKVNSKKAGQTSEKNKSNLSESNVTRKDTFKRKSATKKRRSKEHGSTKDIGVSSACSERGHSTRDKDNRKSESRGITKENETVIRVRKDKSCGGNDKKSDKRSRFPSPSSGRENSRAEKRLKRNSKQHSDQKRHKVKDPDAFRGSSSRETEERSNLEHPKDIDRTERASDNPSPCLSGSGLPRSDLPCKDGSDSSSFDLQKAYDSLCNLSTEHVDGPKPAAEEPMEDEICESFFLLNYSASGFGSEQEDNSNGNTLEECLGNAAFGDYPEPDMFEEMSRRESAEESLQLENADQEPAEKNVLPSCESPLQMPESPQLSGLSVGEEGSSLEHQAAPKIPALSVSSSDVYDPLDELQMDDRMENLEDVAEAKSPYSPSLSSAYTAPSPTSTAPSPTFGFSSPADTAPSPTDTAPSPADTAPSLAAPTSDIDDGSASGTVNSDDGLTSHVPKHRTPSTENTDFGIDQESRSMWNMDKMSVVANKSQRDEEDALSLLAPTLTRDSLFGGEEFEECVQSMEPIRTSAAHKPDSDGQLGNELGQTNRRQPTAIVRPMTYQRSPIMFDDNDELPGDRFSDQGSEQERAFVQEFTGKSVTDLLDELAIEIEKCNIKRAVSLFNFVENKMVGTLKYNTLDSLLMKTESGGILSPQQLVEVVNIVNKVVPTFCDNLRSQVQIFRKCLKTILVCKRTTSLQLLSVRLFNIAASPGLTKLYNDILLAAINAEAPEVLHLYKEGKVIGIRLDCVVVRALCITFHSSHLYDLAQEVYQLGCFVGAYTSVMTTDWPVCLKMRLHYTESEVSIIFRDFIGKIAAEFAGEFFLMRADLTHKEKYTFFICIEDLNNSEGRNIRLLRNAEPSLMAMHKRISNVLKTNNITQNSRPENDRIIELDSDAIFHLLSRQKFKRFPTRLSIKRPNWPAAIFDHISGAEYQSNPL